MSKKSSLDSLGGEDKVLLYEELLLHRWHCMSEFGDWRNPAIIWSYLKLFSLYYCFKNSFQDIHIYENNIKLDKFQGRWIHLLTSITSKMVHLHLMYALLIYFVVCLGSMGTGEDLFYKCWAPSEDLSTHGYDPRNFLLKFEKLAMSLAFLMLKNNNILSSYFMRWIIKTDNKILLGQDEPIQLYGNL